MPYRLAPLFCRPWTLNGITPRLIENHYELNYGDALRRLNAVSAELDALDPAAAPAETINRLKRDETAALNSTLLHELYFASLGGDGRAVPPVLAQALERDFGSVDRWRREFTALSEQLAGGSGWVLLVWLPRDQRLVNQSGTDHNQGIAGGIPNLLEPPSGCRFHPRCPMAIERCRAEKPLLREFAGQRVACHRAEEAA